MIIRELLLCAMPLLVDRTGLGFSDSRSQAVIRRAEVVCRTVYSGCTVRVERRTEDHYNVICKRNQALADSSQVLPYTPDVCSTCDDACGGVNND